LQGSIFNLRTYIRQPIVTQAQARLSLELKIFYTPPVTLETTFNQKAYKLNQGEKRLKSFHKVGTFCFKFEFFGP
jgi:hypothetical protein